MATALVSAIMSVVLLAAGMTIFGAGYSATTQWAQAWRSAQKLTGEQARTALQLVAAEMQDGGGSLRLRVKNVGQAAITELARMDVFVQYTAAAQTRVVRPVHASSGSAGGTWVRSSIDPDTFQPGLWDASEIITLEVHLSPPADAGTTGAVVIGTPMGVTVSGYITLAPPPES